jgi:hypothetical protein
LSRCGRSQARERRLHSKPLRQRIAEGGGVGHIEKTDSLPGSAEEHSCFVDSESGDPLTRERKRSCKCKTGNYSNYGEGRCVDHRSDVPAIRISLLGKDVCVPAIQRIGDPGKRKSIKLDRCNRIQVSIVKDGRRVLQTHGYDLRTVWTED